MNTSSLALPTICASNRVDLTGRPTRGPVAGSGRERAAYLALAAVFAWLLGLQPAHAAGAADDDGNHFYYAIGYSAIQATASGCCASDTRDLGAAALTLGWQPIRYLALEGTALAGIVDSTQHGETLKLSSAYMASLVPIIPLSEAVSVYGRVGYSRITLAASAAGYGSASASDHDTGFGVGMQYLYRARHSQLGGRLEVARLYDRDGVRIAGITLSFMQRF